MTRWSLGGLLCCAVWHSLVAGCASDDAASDGATSSTTTITTGAGGGGVQGPPYQVGSKRYGSYRGFDTQGALDCSASLDFVFYEPSAGGPFPIFVFAKGTRGEWDDDSLIHDEMLRRMAARGFVAVSPDYQSNVDIYPGPYGLSCEGFREKARCIFAPDSEHSDSLVATLDRDTLADSSLGIVTSGISQGGFVALLAADYNGAVGAANPISIGTQCGSNLSVAACASSSGYSLAPERVRVSNGESDATFGGVSTPNCDGMQQVMPSWYREQLNAMTAMSCDTAAGSYECLRANGSGWVLARDDQLVGGLAHHAFCYAQYPKVADANWASTDDAWGREAGQAWLVSMLESP